MTIKLYPNEKVVEVLKDCMENNLTASEAAKKHNIASATVSGWAHRAGIRLAKGKVKQYDWSFIKQSLGTLGTQGS